MPFVFTKILSNEKRKEILAIWNAEFPVGISKNQNEFDIYLKSLNDQRHILLMDNEDQILAWLFIFTREGKRWFAMIIDKKLQKKGHGSTLLNLAKDLEKELNGWVIDQNDDKLIEGDKYLSPLEFYKKNDFKVMPECRLETQGISAVKIFWSKKG